MGSLAQRVVDVLGNAVPQDREFILNVVESMRQEGRELEAIDIAYRLYCLHTKRPFIKAATGLSDEKLFEIEHKLAERWEIAENMVYAKLDKEIIKNTTGILEINLAPLIQEHRWRELAKQKDGE